MSSTAGTVAVAAHDLVKTFRLGNESIHALAGVSLEVTKGSFVSVMGASGSGKSTLLHLLGLLELPDRGSISIGGQDTSGLDDDELTRIRREKLGFVFQGFELIPSLTARENILLPAEIAGRTDVARERLTDLTDRLQITDRLNHRPGQLSGGQRQRVALARALINDPVLVLADEPTGNLDSRTGDEVLELLRQGVDEQGWTVVMVTHDPHAARYGDRIIRLHDGTIVADGSDLPSEESIDAAATRQ